jgi:hypothetical protein
MKLESSLQRSQEVTTNPVVNQMNPVHIFKPYFYLRPGLPGGCLPSDSPNKTFHACPSHIILLDLITWIMFKRTYYEAPHCAISSSNIKTGKV